MCVNKLYIKSNKLDFNPQLDRFFNYVPCGKCDECQAQLRNGYVLRMLSEYDNTKRLGGMTFYITLTYDEQNIRKFNNLFLFDKREVQNFYKRLRSYINIPLKYFISSEYGDKRKRPHYHTVIYLSDTISIDAFKKACQKAWHCGNCFFGINNGVVVDVRPFNYCAKYIVKDSFYYDLDRKLSDVERNELVELEKSGLTIVPFHLQSIGLGLDYVSKLSDFDFIRGYVTYTNIDGLCKKYPIPLYAYRKALYDTYKNKNGNISYKLNLRGQKLFDYRIFNQYSKLLSQLDGYIQEMNIKLNFDISDFAAWKLLYRDLYYYPFNFDNLHHDLEIFHICNNDDSLLLDVENIHPFELDFIVFENKFDDYLLTKKYDAYVKNQENYNNRQYFRCLTTGIYKPAEIKSLSVFINN